MSSATAEKVITTDASEAVATAESIVANAAKADSKESVTTANQSTGEARAWDAKAQID